MLFSQQRGFSGQSGLHKRSLKKQQGDSEAKYNKLQSSCDYLPYLFFVHFAPPLTKGSNLAKKFLFL